MKKIGLILPGGGARGLQQSGMVAAFQDSGLEYDSLYGASVGGLNGALIHSHDFHWLKEIWMNVSNDQVYRWYPWTLGQLFTDKAAIFDSSPLKRLIEKYINPGMIMLNPKPFYINLTSIEDGKALSVLASSCSRDELTQALYGSASPLLAFPPQLFRGHLVCDGGTTNNFSISNAVKDGMDVLIILRATITKYRIPHNIIDSFNILVSLPQEGYLDRELSFVEKLNQDPHYKKIEVHLINTDNDFGISLLDFNYKGLNREKVWQYGYDLTRKALEQVKLSL